MISAWALDKRSRTHYLFSYQLAFKGMVTEQELLELLQREKARNAGTAQPAARPQPVTQQAQYARQLKGVGVIPAMSKEAYLNELIADQLNTGITPIVGGPVVATPTTPADLRRPAPPPPPTVELALPQPTARTVAPPGPVTSGTVVLPVNRFESVQELERLWAGPGEDLDAELPEAQQFRGNDAILGSLWDSTVPEGAQDAAVYRQEVMGEFAPPPLAAFDPADVQFEGSDEIQFNDEGPGISREGREATRFRVDRQDPPPRPPINRHATPVDGQVVSQRGSDGRFQAVERPPRQPPPHPRDAVELFDHGPGGPRPPRRPTRTDPVSFDRSNIPTAWDRVMGDDDF